MIFLYLVYLLQIEISKKDKATLLNIKIAEMKESNK